MSESQWFGLNGRSVRVVEIDGKPWWVARDVCDALGIKNVSDVSERLDEADIMLVWSMMMISEGGLYTLVMRSDGEEAREFQRWVTHEVLPSVRKTGIYAVAAESEPVWVSWFRPS